MSASNNPENTALRLAREIIENTGESLFLTGKAGTGKTTFLRNLVETSKKRLVVLAPTGIAAINASGVTIHSFFQLPFSPYVPGSNPFGGRSGGRFSKMKLQLIRSLDLVIIDEISMVRADLLDAVDAVLRRVRHDRRPFGGVQLLLIGDLQQLPPVLKDADAELLAPYYKSFYFFDSHALSSIPYKTVELTRIYRQDDETFISLLNAIRDNRVDAGVLAALNSRYIPDFVPPASPKYICLTTHNAMARRINEEQLSLLPGKPWTHKATISGVFPETSFPADMDLSLKRGAQVMFIRNDSSGERRFYNGMLGEVTELSDNTVYVLPEGGTEALAIKAETWDNTRYELDKESEEIKETIDGTFSQFPLRLAWAITIHKSQGLTFSHAVIDASRSFAHGQCYVALSRCKTLEGMVIERPLSYSAVICDSRVTDYLRHRQAMAPDEKTVESLMADYRLRLAVEMFEFRQHSDAVADVRHIVEEAFSGIAPAFVDQWRAVEKEVHALTDVSRRFYAQFMPMMKNGGEEEKLQERLRAASRYFATALRRVEKILGETPAIDENKRLDQQLTIALDYLTELTVVRRLILDYFSEADFTVASCLRARSKAALAFENNAPTRKKAAKERKEKVYVPTKNDDVLNPDLYRELILWRRKKMVETGRPAFAILSTEALKGIANAIPATREEFLAVKGFGRKRLEEHGAELTALLDAWRSTH